MCARWRIDSMRWAGPCARMPSAPASVIISTQVTEKCIFTQSAIGVCTRPSMQLIAVPRVPVAFVVASPSRPACLRVAAAPAVPTCQAPRTSRLDDPRHLEGGRQVLRRIHHGGILLLRPGSEPPHRFGEDSVRNTPLARPLALGDPMQPFALPARY